MIRKLKKYKPTAFMAKTSQYSQPAADYAVSFIEALAHTKGSWAGKPFELIDWQEQIIRDVFGILKPNGYRQFNTAYVEIPKKMGKQVALDTPIPTPDGFSTMGAIAVGDIARFESELLARMHSNHASILDGIRTSKALSKDLEAELKAAIEAFAATFA